MTRDELVARLVTQSITDKEKLMEDVRATARREPQMLVDIWLGATSDSDLESGARAVAGGIGELSIAPMLDAVPPADPERRALIVGIAADKEIALHRRLMVRLDQSLDDKALVPVREYGGPKPERTRPKRRVCDEAYLQMWRIMHLGSPILDEILERDGFLNLPFSGDVVEPPYESRDARIQKARISRSWRIAMGWREDDIDAAEEAEKKKGPPLPRH